MKKFLPLFIVTTLLIIPTSPSVSYASESLTLGSNTNLPNQYEDRFSTYLSNETYVETHHPEIISLSKSITQGLANNFDKALYLYLWTIDYMTYDLEKYTNIMNKNFSDEYGALNSIKTRKGVCFDYATLLGALCRASGLPTKIIKGHYRHPDGSREYHAWNLVYISEMDQWIPIDATMSDTKNDYYFYFPYKFSNYTLEE